MPRPQHLSLLIRAGLVAVPGLVLGAAAWDDGGSWDLQPPKPAVAIEVPGEHPTSDCASCHSEVAQEWSDSAHALAWDDEAYQESLKGKRRPQLCHGCHIPQPVLARENLSRKPRPREDMQSHGVSCESCHLGPSGEMLGTHGTQVDAHASAVSPMMSTPGSNKLCSTCHSTSIGPVIGLGKDFTASKQEERGRSCVGCHMASVERRWADGEDVPLRAGRSHALQTPRDPAFVKRAFTLQPQGSQLVVKNEAGHRVPGLIGREFHFEVELLDGGGKVIERRKLKIDATAYLPVDGSRAIEFKKSGEQFRVRGKHVDPRAKKPVVFLSETLDAKVR